MARIQLALNVSDLDAAVDFYGRLFGARPAKRRPGYANFAIEDPPLKLVLFSAAGEPGTINHLGIEVEGPAEVAGRSERMASAGLAPTPEREVACCHALQDKVWVTGADGEPWEVYAVLADIPDGEPASAEACCAPACC